MYTTKNHASLEGEVLDVLTALGDVASVATAIAEGKFSGSADAIGNALEKAILEAEDLYAKVLAREQQTTLNFTLRVA